MSQDEGRTYGQQEEEQDDVEAHNVRKGMNEEPETEGEDDVEAHGGHRHSGPRHS